MGAREIRGLRTTAASLVLAAWLCCGPALAQDEVPATGSNFGGVGLIETRNARFRPDGTLEAGAAIRNQRRFWFVSFQALPFLEATFRLAERLNGTTGEGITTDRSFDLKLRLVDEGAWTPAIAIGAQDIIGTGIYSGEYIVASRRWGRVDVTAGMGWGRMATGQDLTNPLIEVSPSFATRPRDVGQGGTLTNTYFRGQYAGVFGGVEVSLPPLPTPWGDVDGFRFKAEYSSDNLRDERGGYPANTTNLRGQAASRFNAGLQWSNDSVDAGLFGVNGTDLLFRLSLRMNPDDPPNIARPPPPPMPARPPPDPATPAEASLAAEVFSALRAAGLQPVAFGIEGAEARIAVTGGGFRTIAQIATRTLRAVNGLLPDDVQMLRLAWWNAGVEVSEMLIPRAVLEAVGRREASPEEAYAAAFLLPAETQVWRGATRAPGPFFNWGVAPRLNIILGDPSRTARYQFGVALGGRVELGAGFAVAGAVGQALFGNMAGGAPSDSVLPRVRSDYALYAADGTTTVPALYVERIWTPRPDFFARVTAGLLEPMFGGISTELLWRPEASPVALGVDVNYVRQRSTEQQFGFRDYSVGTGQASLYADLPLWNLYTVLRAGRYLAGDWGGTVELGRRFDSGIEVGGFATFTDVSAARFGEGSFDKGIYVRLPLLLFGAQTRDVGTVVIRPVQRDGGQRLAVDSPLWSVTREGRADALRRGMAGFAQ